MRGTKGGATPVKDGANRGTCGQHWIDRRIPALYAAVEPVIGGALVVRAVRIAGDAGAIDGEGRVASAPVASCIGHVGVEFEPIEAVGELQPVGRYCALLQKLERAVVIDETKAVLNQGLDQ